MLLKSLLLLALVILVGCGGGDGGGADAASAPSQAQKTQAERVRDEAFAILQRQYLFPERLPATPEPFADVDALVRALGDPFTIHLSAEEFGAFLDSLEGNVSGIGVIISQESNTGRFVITEVLPNSPAAQAGVMAGDEIVAVDGEPVAGLTLDEVAARIRGDSGTQVTLTLRRAERLIEITLTRQEIFIPSILATLLEDPITHTIFGFVQQTLFTQTSAAELLSALQIFRAVGARGIILDLRGNPGGLVAAALEEADLFIADQRPPGTFTDLFGCTTADLHDVLVRIFDRDGQEGVCVADDFDGFTLLPYNLADRAVGLPLVILVDQTTASAAELLVAALRENGAFPGVALVGSTTFGKGLIQIVQSLSDGSGLIFVALEFKTPAGNPITGHGLTPDIVVADDPTTPDDEALEVAKRHLMQVIGHAPLTTVTLPKSNLQYLAGVPQSFASSALSLPLLHGNRGRVRVGVLGAPRRVDPLPYPPPLRKANRGRV